MIRSTDMKAPICLDRVSAQTERVLGAFLAGQARAAIGPEQESAARDIGGLIAAGGKRIRPQLCVLGWYAAGGEGEPDALVKAAASLELFHAFALIHDDVMDDSALRRSRPALHRALADRHRSHTDPVRLGVNAAILIGDLAFAWSQQMLHTAGLAPGRLAAALPVVDAMHSEVMYGQYLDLLATGTEEPPELDRVLAVARFKTATYTVERPLHLGAVLAGADPDLLTALSKFAVPIGEAFQLRDDLLGVYGDPAATGKPCSDDLRDGKHTALTVLALQHADPTSRAGLRQLLGRPDLDDGETDRLRRLIRATGAPHLVEQMIDDRRAQALGALQAAGLPSAATAALEAIARSATGRIR
ncbi:polyprenyl synthetase family protein [Streptomyces sp. NBC_00069]|uniref:polyprenyl synthetase family protein n=1 Tax=Streptomyces sp. NBC_00069 TaxID=2975639 RepID=UPI003252065A